MTPAERVLQEGSLGDWKKGKNREKGKGIEVRSREGGGDAATPMRAKAGGDQSLPHFCCLQDRATIFGSEDCCHWSDIKNRGPESVEDLFMMNVPFPSMRFPLCVFFFGGEMSVQQSSDPKIVAASTHLSLHLPWIYRIELKSEALLVAILGRSLGVVVYHELPTTLKYHFFYWVTS